MLIKISATSNNPHMSALGTERTPIVYKNVLGLHEYENIEQCILYLKEQTKETEYVVSYENNQWEIEIYNDYRE